ncbi:MAG: response regulator [Alphaproteobacteria bacterium]|nr:response regulator [Alphaproteobacteria bacterium]
MTNVMQVLLIEDNEGDVEMTQRALRDSQPTCALSVANDGVEGLEFLRKQGRFGDAKTPQLILLDLNMPRMDGKKFLESVKSDAELRLTPVVMLTSSESPSDVNDCYWRHASGYVVKPFDVAEFSSRLKQVVRFWGAVSRLPA